MKPEFRTVVVCAALLASAPVLAGDWPAFRGPRGDGHADEVTPPLEWSADKNVVWKAPLPQPGNSSPIVSKDCVFVTCAEDAKGTKRSLYCFDRRTGNQRWVKTAEFDKVEETHKDNPYCGSTPVADGTRVIAWHGSAGIFCYDFEGKPLWSRKLLELKHIWGDGTSPVIHQDRVIVHCGPGPHIRLMALDLNNGKTLWDVEEPVEGDGSYRNDKKYMGSWTTPIIVRVEGRNQVICTMPTRVVGYDFMTGKVLWWCDGIRGSKGDLAYSSPVIVGNIVVSIGGFGGPGIGFTLGGSGDITTSNRLWRTEQNPQSIGSGVVVDGYFYRPNADPGTIECVDPKTGKTVWQNRAGGGTYWGSIVYAGGVCFVSNQVGQTVVFRPNPQQMDLLAKNDLGEPSNSTPAVADGQIFLRTFQHLYCVAQQ